MEKTDNELIAEFMGCKWLGEGYHDNSDTNFHQGIKDQDGDIVEAQYGTSWDWLMPVVEKISNIHPSICNGEMLAIARYKAATSLPMSTPIDIVYKAVVEFIKWYNQQ